MVKPSTTPYVPPVDNSGALNESERTQTMIDRSHNRISRIQTVGLTAVAVLAPACVIAAIWHQPIRWLLTALVVFLLGHWVLFLAAKARQALGKLEDQR